MNIQMSIIFPVIPTSLKTNDIDISKNETSNVIIIIFFLFVNVIYSPPGDADFINTIKANVTKGMNTKTIRN